jgi:hypothetical protein
MHKKLIEEFKKLSGLNEEDFQVGDIVDYKDQYMNRSLRGKILKKLSDDNYLIRYALVSGKEVEGTKNSSDLNLVKRDKKVEKSQPNKKLGKVVKILPGNRPEPWDEYIGEYAVIDDEVMSAYRVTVLSGDVEPEFYIPKQYVEFVKDK